MELDEETLEQLGLGSQADSVDYARYLAVLKERRTRASRASYESQFTTRKQRADRAKRNAPVLKGYARIKAWREKNPGKYKKIQQRYERSNKRRLKKSERARQKYHEKKAA